MNAYIFLNGEYGYTKEYMNDLIKSEDIVFCADGGANYAFNYNVKVNYIVGDLDSIKLNVLEYYKKKDVIIEKYNPEKDYTDFELIIEKIKKFEMENKNKFAKIYVLGGLGKRIDMTLSNIHLLEEYKNLIFLSSNGEENEEIFFKENSFVISNRINYEFSIIPISENIKKLYLEGFKYELKGENIKRKSSRLVSNIIFSNNAKINFESGKLLIILRSKN